ncbi:MAG TPA: LysR family transcriptional regulator [Solirubrobacteraceae bacterium]|nr:LysR family transcriptional regulator [Solirubrobacteraceae bacterium]
MERSIGSIESRLEIRGLRALLAVADFGSFRSAAVELGYTQSAISHQVAELERALGASLFTRPGGRGAVALTRAGEAAYLHARRAFTELHALDASVQATLRGERTVVRVGVFQTAAAELLPAALTVLREEWPGVEVVLSETDDDPRLIDWLADGRLDLALTINQEPDDRVEVIRLYDDPWVVLTRRDSELAAVERPSFELLDGEDVVAWTSRWEIQGLLEEAWRRRGIKPRVVYRTDDNLALQRLVAAGLGHACIGRLAAERAIDPSLTWLAPPDVLLPRTVALCHPRGRDLADAARALSAALRAQFGR